MTLKQNDKTNPSFLNLIFLMVKKSFNRTILSANLSVCKYLSEI